MKKKTFPVYCLLVSVLIASCGGGQSAIAPTSVPASEAAATAAPESTQAPTSTPELVGGIPPINSVSKSQPVAYPKEIFAEDNASGSLKITVPASVGEAPAGTNVKLWLADPRSPERALGGGGIFIQPEGADWYFVGVEPDGAIYMTLESGVYQIDSTEPNGFDQVMKRHRYVLTVSASGEPSIDGLEKDERGFFAITLDLLDELSPEAAAEMERLTALAEEPANTFVPASACQLLDQVTADRSFYTDLSAGFPKVRVRLPSYGNIKALIVPVDFPDVPGKDDPVSYFTEVANGVTDFYYLQSYGRLTFDFTIVPNWVRVPFDSMKYGGGYGAGDPAGYLNAVIALTDPQIDYSEFDAVYYLMPKEMPIENMGWGPAITFPYPVSNGIIINGATGGADMYFNEQNGVEGARWKWMAHETGHAFGLYDEDLNHQSQSLGYWSIMANNWSTGVVELGAWDRYLQGWLTEDQITCTEKAGIPAEGVTVKLNPIVRQNTEVKAIMVPLSSSKILVLESRRNEELDHLSASDEGLLAYTVDMTIGQLGGGYVIQPRPGFTDTYGYQDGALRAGDAITVDGVTVTVLEADTDGDTVKVTLE